MYNICFSTWCQIVFNQDMQRYYRFLLCYLPNYFESSWFCLAVSLMTLLFSLLINLVSLTQKIIQMNACITLPHSVSATEWKSPSVYQRFFHFQLMHHNHNSSVYKLILPRKLQYFFTNKHDLEFPGQIDMKRNQSYIVLCH